MQPREELVKRRFVRDSPVFHWWASIVIYVLSQAVLMLPLPLSRILSRAQARGARHRSQGGCLRRVASLASRAGRLVSRSIQRLATWNGGPVRVGESPPASRSRVRGACWRSPAARRNVFVVFGALIVLAGSAGCAGSVESPRYPDRFLALSEPFEAALGDADAGVAEEALFEGVPPSALGFVNLMRSISDDPDWRAKAREVYASELYFNDTLGTASNIDELLTHLQGVADNAESLNVSVQDVVTSRAGTYLRWHMVSRFSVLGSSRESRTIGVSLLRFDEDGRIVFQQDYWDSTEGFYQHIPVLGSALRAIGRRFQ